MEALAPSCTTLTAPNKIDRRGMHYINKAVMLDVWKSTSFWAEEQLKLEKEILATTSLKTLPWHYFKNSRSIGNQAKYIWMTLFLYDHHQIIKIDWKPNDNTFSFFGIAGFSVLDPEQFNRGLFPLPSAWKGKHSGMPFEKKTLVHNWHAVGMVEVASANRMVFDDFHREKVKRQRMRMDEKRHAKLRAADPTTQPPADAQPTTLPPMITTTPLDMTDASSEPLPPLLETTTIASTPLHLLSHLASQQRHPQAAIAAAREAVIRAQADVEATSSELYRAQLKSDMAYKALHAAHAQLAKAQMDHDAGL